MQTCTICHQPTDRIYRQITKPGKDNENLIACCKSCADEQNSESQKLAISMILKEEQK